MKANMDRTWRRAAAAAALAAVIPAGAMAGSPDPAPMEPVVPAPAPAGVDWTGFYGGAQLGFADVEASGGLDGDGAIGGLTLGYDYDFGNYVVGGALDYDFADIDVGGAATVESVARAKLRAGAKIGGSGLLYATGGGAQADAGALGTDTGYFLGGGYEQMVTDNFSVGGEALWHDFEDFDGSGVDVNATTLQVRGTFRF
jgi:opacity protein-like surface antigen